MYKRILNLKRLARESTFLWGPRQTGKSTLLQEQFKNSVRYDLLMSDEYQRLLAEPSLMRNEVLEMNPTQFPVIIDEVQKIPILLDDVQWLIVNHKIPFILCGSSARKLKRGAGNHLGGRALRHELFPLVYPEIPSFNLFKALENGLLPRHYDSQTPQAAHRSYIGDYLKEEISQEALLRDPHVFSGFLKAAAFSNGEIVNYSNIASDSGVSLYIIKEYFQILSDTLIGKFIHSFQKKPKRRVIQAPKFYFFDLCIVNQLLNRTNIPFPGELFGKAFEQFIYQEISAHHHYSGKYYEISYWRTASQLEVDFILGDHEVALEVKGTKQVRDRDLKGLHAFMEEYKVKHAIVVSLDSRPRKVGEITIMPWKVFLEKLWGNEVI